jgi:hypothetical protein
VENKIKNAQSVPAAIIAKACAKSIQACSNFDFAFPTSAKLMRGQYQT